ncbi:MAG: hypothetical protein N2255_06340 [Kiritimatiellae bacterium]|nr:hypothetical protein [Kiritimatiellia bacterium]
MGIFLAVEAALPEVIPVTFARKPEIFRTENQLTIRFGLNRPCDVAIYIENAQGRVVRHLAAGLLGENAPAPLKPASLEQTLDWDFKDDLGRSIPPDSYRVRICAGLRINHAEPVFAPHSGPNCLGGVSGLATGPEGRLYVLSHRGGRGRPHWRGTMLVHVFRRDGSYEKTIKPPPAWLDEKNLKPIGAFRDNKQNLTPLLFHPWSMSFYPYMDLPHQPVVTDDGHLLLAVAPIWPKRGASDRPWTRDMNPKPGAHIAAIDSEGGIPYESYAGPPLLGEISFEFPYLAVGSGGKKLYVTGLGKNTHAIYVVPLPERGPADLFFGDPGAPGNDDRHLNKPSGLACDGQGHLFVADSENNRVIVISEETRKSVGKIDVDSPRWVGVHRRLGHLYVHSGQTLVKFRDWRSVTKVCALDLKTIPAPVSPSSGYYKHWRTTFALDDTQEPPVIWIGQNMGPRALLRCEDLGDSFSAPTVPDYYNSPSFWNLSADPERQKVAVRTVGPEVGAEWSHTLSILAEQSGAIRVVDPKRASQGLRGPAMTHPGGIYRLGPGELIFCMGVCDSISRHDASGKWLPYEGTEGFVHTTNEKRAGLMENPWTGQSGWTRDFWVDSQTNVYVHRRLGEHPVSIDVYDGSTGKFKRTAIPSISRNAFGPRVDAQGAIYVAEAVKPGTDLYPSEFAEHISGRPNEYWYVWMYGSLIKFGPEGGGVWWPRDEDGTFHAQEALQNLPQHLQKQPVTGCHGGRLDRRTILQGARWCHFGFSHVSQKPLCHCIGTDFDVDGFGRVFYPDLLRFCVHVLDTNGNELLRFGAYGNQDSCGTESYVRDPRSGVLRPRRKDDPPDLPVPGSQPTIAFAWIIGLAVTDRYVYVADELNQRVLRCRIDHELTQSLKIE